MFFLIAPSVFSNVYLNSSDGQQFHQYKKNEQSMSFCINYNVLQHMVYFGLLDIFIIEIYSFYIM